MSTAIQSPQPSTASSSKSFPENVCPRLYEGKADSSLSGYFMFM